MKRYIPYVLIALVVGGLFVSFVLPGSKSGGETADLGGSGEALKGAPIVTVAIPAELSTNATIGKTGFEAKCAVCHGLNAAGQDGVAPHWFTRSTSQATTAMKRFGLPPCVACVRITGDLEIWRRSTA